MSPTDKPAPPRLDTARELVRRCWLNPTEAGLREARRSLVRRMWRARKHGYPEHYAELREMYNKIYEQQFQQDWLITPYQRSARYRARLEPVQLLREQVQRQGKGRAVGLNIPQEGAWEPKSESEQRIYCRPAPSTATPELGSAALVQALRSVNQRPHRRRPRSIDDEFEHYVVIGARSRSAAQREFWRHVANRACLAILADCRLPAVPPRPSAPSTTPPQAPPRPVIGGDVFLVEVEAIQMTIEGLLTQTQPLALEMLVCNEVLSMAARLSLAVLREWPTPQTVDPLFKYRRAKFGFERRAGLSGDMVTLFEELLRPHAEEMLWALGMK